MLLGHRVSQKSILWPLVVVMLPGWLVLVSLVRRPATDWHVQMAFRERVVQQMQAYDYAEQIEILHTRGFTLVPNAYDYARQIEKAGSGSSLPARRASIATLFSQWHKAGLTNDPQLVDEAVVWLRLGDRDKAAAALAEVKKPESASHYFTLALKAAQGRPLETEDQQKLEWLRRTWGNDWWVLTVARLHGISDGSFSDISEHVSAAKLAWRRLRIADGLLPGLGIVALLLAVPAWKLLCGTWKVWPYCERVQRLWPVPLMLCVLSLRGLFLLLGGTVAGIVVRLVSAAGQHDILTVIHIQECLNFVFNMLVAVATTYGVKECVASNWGTLGDVLGFERTDFFDRRLWCVAFPCAVMLVFGLEPLPQMLDQWHIGGASLFDTLSRSPGGYGPLGAILSVTQAVIIAPVIEEIIYRGFLLSTLRSRFGVVPGVLLSSAIYAMAHGASVAGTVTAFLYGTAYAGMKLHTGRLGAAMLMHGCVAAIVTALMLLHGG